MDKHSGFTSSPRCIISRVLPSIISISAESAAVISLFSGLGASAYLEHESSTNLFGCLACLDMLIRFPMVHAKGNRAVNKVAGAKQ